MPLYIRLSLMIWGLLLGGFGLVILLLFIEAGPRVRAETESVMQLTRDFIGVSVGAEASPGPTRATLESYVDRLAQMRHVDISIVAVASASRQEALPVPVSQTDWSWAQWLIGELWQEAEPIVVPLRLAGGEEVAVRILPRPEDEFDEVTEALASVSVAGVGVALGVLLLTSWLIARALTPLRTMAAALQRLEDGDYTVAVRPEPQREFAAIVSRVNTLAAALLAARLENQRLNRRLVEIQDEERGDIAGELHDELGPWLFSVRAEATALRRESERPAPSLERIGARTAAILSQVEAIQETNRRVLRKLSPAGLDELGLATAIEGLIAQLRSGDAAPRIDLDIDRAIDGLDKTQTLTVYRVVQEGLTNALRHAGASWIGVQIRLHLPEAGVDGASHRQVEVEVADDGKGPGSGAEPGYGLRHMRQRIQALSGRFSFAARTPCGTVLRAMLPIEFQTVPVGQKPISVQD